LPIEQLNRVFPIGGAICNTLLQTLYDAENRANDLLASGAGCFDHPNLFDGDDDEKTVDASRFTCDLSIFSFGTLRRYDAAVNKTINGGGGSSMMTYMDLMREMKTKMKSAGYAQAPAITSLTKFDLNQPFENAPC